MKTLVCVKSGQFEYTERIQPQLEKNRAIIRIKRIGICGTDLHAFEGTQPFFNYPRVLGHELSGELVAFHNAPGFTEGESVTFIPYYSCGVCIACRMSKTNCCVHMQVSGVHIDGGMTEYLSVPSSALLHGHGLSLDELALIEPLAIGAHGIRRAAVTQDEFVLVVGAGPIGLAAMDFARVAGGKVIALDLNKNRLQFCKNKLHVEHIIDASSATVSEQLQEITNGDMPTVVIDATGSRNAINHSFQYMAHGARYVLIGLQKGEISFSHPEFHKREGTLMSSRNATKQDFEHVINSVKTGRVNPLQYITHHVHFDNIAKEFEGWLQPDNRMIIKVLVEMN